MKYVIQDIKEDLSDCVRDWCDKYSNDIKNRQSLLSNNDTPQHELQHLQMQLSALTNVKDAVNGKWVITSSKDENILKAACDDIQCHIRDNNVGFIMPESYIAVLNYLYQLRNDARPNTDIDSSRSENVSSSSNNILKVDDNNSQDISQLDVIFCSVQDLKRRIRRNVRHVNNNDNQNDSGLQWNKSYASK